MASDDHWWEEAFGRTSDTVASLEDRVRRLEIDFRNEQKTSGETRKRLQEAHSRLNKAKDALEFSLALLLIPAVAVAARYIWTNYDGWEFAAAWLGTGAIIAIFARDAFSKIERI